MALDLVILKAETEINSKQIAHIISASVKHPPAIPVGLLDSKTLITYPQGVKIALRASEVLNMAFNEGIQVDITKLLTISKDLWLKIAEELAPYPPEILAHWIVWGLNWIIIDNCDVQQYRHLDTRMMMIQEEINLRAK